MVNGKLEYYYNHGEGRKSRHVKFRPNKIQTKRRQYVISEESYQNDKSQNNLVAVLKIIIKTIKDKFSIRKLKSFSMVRSSQESKQAAESSMIR